MIRKAMHLCSLHAVDKERKTNTTSIVDQVDLFFFFFFFSFEMETAARRILLTLGGHD